VELTILVLEYLDTPDVRGFALCSRACNEIAETRLWCTFAICSHGKTAASRAIKRCQTILRNRSRARRILKLIVGPCTWTWTPALIQHISCVWHVVSRLKMLLLKMPTMEHTDSARGGEFAPLLRSLVQSGTHLRLEVFKYEGWLIPDSYLHRFLMTQTGLRQLIGVDMFPTRLVDCPKAFLPSLRLLVCERPEIAIRLTPGRPISARQIDAIREEKDLLAISMALGKCPGPLEDIRLYVYGHGVSFAECLQALKSCLTGTKTLRVWGAEPQEDDINLLCDLHSLETIHLELGARWDPEHLSLWPSRMSPSINTIVVSRTLHTIMYQRCGESKY